MSEDKRTVLITGVAGGIGKAAVEFFAKKGWQVIGVDMQAVDEFPKDGLFIQTDLADPDNIEDIAKQAAEFSPGLNALVNNAAMQIAKPFQEMTVEEWDKLMAVNLRAVFLLSQKTYLLLKHAQGTIVNVSSVHAVATSTDIAAYAASKGGVLAMTRALAIECAPDNVRVNAVLPGAVDTPMLDEGLSRGQFGDASMQDRKEELASKTVIGRVGLPEEIAKTIYFLADNESSAFMTGQSLIVDGGATARLSSE